LVGGAGLILDRGRYRGCATLYCRATVYVCDTIEVLL
jgi:hypothetical protein